jgi:hypothetical protein
VDMTVFDLAAEAANNPPPAGVDHPEEEENDADLGGL